MTINKSGIENIESVEIRFNSLLFIPTEKMTSEEMFELTDRICEKIQSFRK